MSGVSDSGSSEAELTTPAANESGVAEAFVRRISVGAIERVDGSHAHLSDCTGFGESPFEVDPIQIKRGRATITFERSFSPSICCFCREFGLYCQVHEQSSSVSIISIFDIGGFSSVEGDAATFEHEIRGRAGDFHVHDLNFFGSSEDMILIVASNEGVCFQDIRSGLELYRVIFDLDVEHIYCSTGGRDFPIYCASGDRLFGFSFPSFALRRISSGVSSVCLHGDKDICFVVEDRLYEYCWSRSSTREIIGLFAGTISIHRTFSDHILSVSLLSDSTSTSGSGRRHDIIMTIIECASGSHISHSTSVFDDLGEDADDHTVIVGSSFASPLIFVGSHNNDLCQFFYFVSLREFYQLDLQDNSFVSYPRSSSLDDTFPNDFCFIPICFESSEDVDESFHVICQFSTNIVDIWRIIVNSECSEPAVSIGRLSRRLNLSTLHEFLSLPFQVSPPALAFSPLPLQSGPPPELSALPVDDTHMIPPPVRRPCHIPRPAPFSSPWRCVLRPIPPSSSQTRGATPTVLPRFSRR
jgi:hypothetical protein